MNDIKDKLSKILEEIAPYEVKLEEDPTRPDLGTKYLQKAVAECRGYMNRVTFYYQEIAREERKVRLELKTVELDLEFKTREKLADDPDVKKQPSIADREALAATMLREEHEKVGALRLDLLDIQETIKLVKFKHSELQRTSQDIKMQRSLVKDDAMMRLGGQEGYDRPVVNQNRTVPNGLPAPVTSDDLNPTDLLDPGKRPEYVPEPVDMVHARMVADFYANSKPDPIPSRDEPVRSISYDDLLS